MRAEHLLQWIQEAMREETPDATHWLKVVTVVQAIFRDGRLADKSTWKMVALMMKDYGRDFWGIGLLEVLWKTVTGILNHSFAS